MQGFLYSLHQLKVCLPLLYLLPHDINSKCSKSLNTSLYVFKKMLVFRAVIHKMLVIMANMKDPDQTP